MQLIERESELSTLSTYLENIRTGAGTLALVGGEAGAGKSALVSAFLDEVAVRIAAGSCDGLSTPRPLGPIIEMQRSSRSTPHCRAMSFSPQFSTRWNNSRLWC
jgi:predicted ATPase